MAKGLTKKQRKKRNRILVALAIFVALLIAEHGIGLFERIENGLWIAFFAYLVPYLIAGYDVLSKAWHGITHEQPFDENLLMAIATIGAFALVFFPEAEPHMAEGAAVMLFYQVGELFESYATNKTRRSIAEMMDIAPEYATVEAQDGTLLETDPAAVEPGSTIVIKPGERIPLDGIVVSGISQLDTSALTGESAPVDVDPQSEVFSGSVNLTGLLRVRTTKPYGESTVARILDLVETASEKKARTESFITRFARYYTPVVVALALAIALISPLFGVSLTASVQSALVFLVVSCPCALVISVPLSFFSGIGAASKQGILVKGSGYLETLDKTTTIAFDKTGTLTQGTFEVASVHPADPAYISAEQLIFFAAHAEAFSNHPIAVSLRNACPSLVNQSAVSDVEEHSGKGVAAVVDGHRVFVGNSKLIESETIAFEESASSESQPTDAIVGTVVHVAVDGRYAGSLVITDAVKDDVAQAITELRAEGVKRTVMLSGDRRNVAESVAAQVGIDEVHAELMPQDKVAALEELLSSDSKEALAFVGDGINDAPVLMRADVGIAMGALGSDAAIEAADIVLMDDSPSKIATAMRIARKTMRIVKENIVFAIGVKLLIMILALPFIGIATMWLAVFGDVGVAILAITNAMRALRAS